MMNLGNLRKSPGSIRRKRRVGRGKGSGWGNQATSGQGGQNARSGSTQPYAGFEGGQMRLIRLLPKRGFTKPNRIPVTIVNLTALEVFDADTDVTTSMMMDKGLVKTLRWPIKILARGEISKPLTVHAHRFSNSAKAKIEKAGGKVEVV